MITRAELQTHAREGTVDERTQERDYVLAWLLAGLASDPDRFVFKGGTCLRRCYFPGYRYSEDLDFTLDASVLAFPADVLNTVQAWCTWIGSEAGIAAIAEPDDGATNRRVWVSYTGPLKSRRERAIKVDATDTDEVVDGVAYRSLLSEYSDLEAGLYQIPCYSLAEVWAEKTRSLMQRAEPRDAYDLVYLARHDRGLADEAKEIFVRKAESKGLDPQNLARLITDREQSMRRRWDDRLTDQVAEVPPFDATWRELRRILRQSGYMDS